MSSPTATAAALAAPFEVYSVHFDFPGSQAIGLRDPATNQFIGITPEWVAATRNEMAAYVRETRPGLRVVFRGTPAINGTYSVGAGGSPVRVEESRISLTFDAATGLSGPVDLRAQDRLPNRIGLHDSSLRWYARTPADSPYSLPAGTSNHRICTTWRVMTPNAGQKLFRWVYRPLMEWTSQWAAGQDDEKEICDAIIRNIGSSGLRYGRPLLVSGVRSLLQNGGGMCGDWYKVFQQMAHCQGVFVHRRAFLVDWRVEASGEERWCAIVIRRGGLNQAHPTHPESDFHDNDTGYPIAVPVHLVLRRERRYQFFGPRKARYRAPSSRFRRAIGRRRPAGFRSCTHHLCTQPCYPAYPRKPPTSGILFGGIWLDHASERTGRCRSVRNRVGGGLSAPVLPHHRTYFAYPAVQIMFVTSRTAERG